MQYDVFISHASEDKESFVEPLAKALEEAGLKVWYDRFVLKLGDILHVEIDQGLASSRYGVVVLSKDFFAKNWPKTELDALITRENADGKKVILPIWHEVTAKDVEKFSPILASKFSAQSSNGIGSVVAQILDVCNEEIDVKPVKKNKMPKNDKLIENLKKIQIKYNHLDIKIFLDTESNNANRTKLETELVEILTTVGFDTRGSGNSVIMRGSGGPPIQMLLNPANIPFAEELSITLKQFIDTEFTLEKDEAFPMDSLKIFITGEPMFSPDGVVTFR